MIHARGVTKTYGTLTAVSHLDLEIPAGEIFAFLGPNGAGKTTTIKMLVGLLKPSMGEISLAGINLLSQSQQAKSIIGYVPDQPNLYERLTPGEFWELVGKVYRIPREEVAQRVEEYSALFELTGRERDLIGEFSHGMRQKVCLIGALVHRPKILFLDEPTVGLDPASAKKLKELLSRLAQEGVTVFLSTHILEIAERMAHRVGIIQQGRLLFTGSVPQLRALLPDQEEATLEDLFLHLTTGVERE